MTSLWGRRSPPAGWEGFFFIGIFPAGAAAGAAGADLAWCKVHLFSGGLAPAKHCLAALEGLDGAAQELLLVGRPNGIARVGERLASTDIASVGLSAHGRDVRFDEVDGNGVTRITAPGFDASIALPPPAHEHDALFWIRAPRLLTYFSATGEARVRIAGPEGEVTHTGFGLLEHAWGAQTRLDVARLAPRRWHWDVLWLGGSRFFAGLSIRGVGIHGGARLAEGERLERVHRVRMRVRDVAADGSPLRWEGTMATRRGTLRYEARASTPMAPEVPGGGFLGFAWEGELDRAPCAGSGFCEQRRA